jgi:hypothetical protein
MEQTDLLALVTREHESRALSLDHCLAELDDINEALNKLAYSFGSGSPCYKMMMRPRDISCFRAQ